MSNENIAAVRKRIVSLHEELSAKYKEQGKNAPLPDSVVDFVATSFQSGKLALEGAVIRLKAFQIADPNGKVSLDEARDVLKDMQA